MQHYTYMLIDPITDMKYIGVRSCNCPIEEDTYKGSSRAMTKEEKQRSDKMIIKTFDNREDAMKHEIELHDKYDVAVNPRFWNKCKSTSTGFSVLGTSREFTDEHIQKMKDNRQGSGNTTYRLDTVYEWVHKNGEELTGTIGQMVKHSGKDSSAFYKIFKNKALYASGWRVKKNTKTGIGSSDLNCSGRKRLNNKTKQKLTTLQQAGKTYKYRSTYLWCSNIEEQFVGTVYELVSTRRAASLDVGRRCVIGEKGKASGWRIVKNMDSGCVTTDLNHGKGIKVKLTTKMVK